VCPDLRFDFSKKEIVGAAARTKHQGDKYE
jgi:hypothetical protein